MGSPEPLRAAPPSAASPCIEGGRRSRLAEAAEQPLTYAQVKPWPLGVHDLFGGGGIPGFSVSQVNLVCHHMVSGGSRVDGVWPP